MRILSIETSCDDTGIAIVEYNGNQITILSNIVNTQTIHADYGGVFPAMAKREHIANIQGVYEEACQQANIDANSLNIDAIAVTVGPAAYRAEEQVAQRRTLRARERPRVFRRRARREAWPRARRAHRPRCGQDSRLAARPAMAGPASAA